MSDGASGARAQQAAPVQLAPVVLEGNHVRLEPIGEQHLDGLMRAGAFDEIWTWMPWQPRTREEYIRWHGIGRVQGGDAGVTFVTIGRANGEVLGSTSFMNVSGENRRLEIGGTWLTPRAQRTAINTEAKHLQLRHCFEVLGCLRVEFKTDARNATSRAAIARLGAVQEGILRKHQKAQHGIQRDSVYFSITDDEWPSVRQRLERILPVGRP